MVLAPQLHMFVLSNLSARKHLSTPGALSRAVETGPGPLWRVCISYKLPGNAAAIASLRIKLLDLSLSPLL